MMYFSSKISDVLEMFAKVCSESLAYVRYCFEDSCFVIKRNKYQQSSHGYAGGKSDLNSIYL